MRDSVEGEEGEYEAPGLERGGGWDDILELLVMSGFYDHRMLMVWRLEGGRLLYCPSHQGSVQDIRENTIMTSSNKSLYMHLVSVGRTGLVSLTTLHWSD